MNECAARTWLPCAKVSAIRFSVVDTKSKRDSCDPRRDCNPAMRASGCDDLEVLIHASSAGQDFHESDFTDGQPHPRRYSHP